MNKDNLPEFIKSKTPKAYKNKKLNNANFGDFNHTDYQVFLHLVSKIGGVDKLGKYLQPEQMQREHVLTAKEFSEVFNTPLSHCYGILKKTIDKLMKTDITVEKLEPKREVWRINVCSQAKYNKDEGYISVKFTDDIMPYLAQVRKKFVLYNLKEISNFGSLYTTRLYELLQEFQETGWMLKSVEQLREIFAVGSKLKAYKDFKIKTFGHACEEINANYDIDLSFEEIKESRRVVAIKFSFKKTAVIRRIDQAGIIHNTYDKPSVKKRAIKSSKIPKKEMVLKDQLAFKDLEDESKFEDLNTKPINGPKSIGSMIAPLLQKLMSKKK